MRAVLGLIGLLAAAPGAAANDSPVLDLGRQIYEQGILPDGSPLAGVVANEVRIAGRDAACSQCHRRSGMGSSEGELRVPAITASILAARPVPFRAAREGREPQPLVLARRDTRAPYDSSSLARAIVSGIDSADRPLSSLMPRYTLDARAMRALQAYLQQLGATPDAGLSPGRMRLATIVTPDAEPGRRDVVLQSLQAWARKGAVSRLETPLDVWQLSGPESKWQGQLEAYYRKQPVFAVLSGAGGTHWSAVEAYCQAQRLPCLFPLVDAAPNDTGNYYSFYFTAGVPMEARILAAFMREQAPGRVFPVVSDDAGHRAAKTLAAELPDRLAPTLDWDVAAAGKLAADLTENDSVVAWLRPAQVEALLAALAPGAHVYLSSRLAPPEVVAIPPAWRERVRWISQRTEPGIFHAGNMVGLQPWASYIGVPLTDEVVQAELYAATYFFGEALGRMRGRFSRDYLLESLEMGDYWRTPGRLFYNLSLGPTQRVGAKNGHIQGFMPPEYSKIGRISPLLVP